MTTSIDMQAAAARHVAAGGAVTDEIRGALSDAAATLAYHAAHPGVMRACAYFERTAAWSDALFEQMPDARIIAVGRNGDLSNGQ